MFNISRTLLAFNNYMKEYKKWNKDIYRIHIFVDWSTDWPEMV